MNKLYINHHKILKDMYQEYSFGLYNTNGGEEVISLLFYEHLKDFRDYNVNKYKGAQVELLAGFYTGFTGTVQDVSVIGLHFLITINRKGNNKASYDLTNLRFL